MHVESIEIPAERVPPVATDASGAAKNVAAVVFFIMFIFVVAAIGVMTGGSTKSSGETDGVSLAFGMLFWVGLFAFIGFRFARNASRATRAANLAKTDPRYTWRLSGKHVIAADGAGVPRPDVSFKINGKLRTMLLAVPRAEVVDGRGQY
jgi:hypothetical protein